MLLPSLRPLPENPSVLDLAHRLELAMARLYEVLAEAHGNLTEASSLWRGAATEERQHAAQIQVGGSGARPIVADLKIAWRDARELLDRIEGLVRRFQSTPPSFAEALTIALQLEESLAHLHMNRACRFANTAYQSLFDAMMVADRKQVRILREAILAYAAAANLATP